MGKELLIIKKFLTNIASIVIQSEKDRNLRMSENLVVIEDSVELTRGGLDDNITAMNFYGFLSQRLLDTKEASGRRFLSE